MNIFTLFLFRRMCQNLLISAPDAGTRHFWHTSLAKGIDIRKEIKTDKDMNKKKLIIGIVGVLVVAGGIWFFTGKTSKGGIRLETAKVGRSSISNTVTATGTVEPVTEVEVGTQVSGIIDKLYADYNDVVKAGQLIAEMDKVNLKAELASAEAQLASSKSEFEYQQKNYARNKILFEKKLISDSDYETSTYNYEKAKAAYEQNQAAMVKVNRNLEYATITSPIDGVVIVTSPQSLVSMIVSKAVNMARMMNIPVYGSSSSSTSTSTVVTYEVVISADNPDLKLKPRLTANVTIFTLERDNVLTVPTKSLRFVPDAGMLTQLGYIVSEAGKETPAGKRLVWIKNGQELKPKAVTVGSTSGNMIEITDGLNEGEELAVDLEASSITPAAEAETERSPFMPGPPGSNKNKKSAK